MFTSNDNFQYHLSANNIRFVFCLAIRSAAELDSRSVSMHCCLLRSRYNLKSSASLSAWLRGAVDS